MSQKTFRILFLCTGNSARSIMAEALITLMGKGRFAGFSAGSQPTGSVNPFALEQIRQYDASWKSSDMRSKSWNEFAAPDAPVMDAIITVCDNAAGEVCPCWPGHPASAHWGFEDPAAVPGTDEDKRRAFTNCFRQIHLRVAALTALPVETMSKSALRAALQAIGEMKV